MRTPDVNLEALLERVAKLERQNRFWKLGGLLAALLLVFSLAVAVRAQQDTPNVPNVMIAKFIKAQDFVLTDADGTKRGELTVTNGVSKLELYSAAGKVTWSTNPGLGHLLGQ